MLAHIRTGKNRHNMQLLCRFESETILRRPVMIQLVMKPEKAPVVNREGLYSVRMNGEHLLHVRARNAPHAERTLAYCFKRELSGKTLDFNLEEMENEDNTAADDSAE